MIKKIKVTPNLYVLRFNNQKEMAFTFLRFQEHYESPEFAGKIFTHEEFKEWYKKQNNGKFTYHNDWTGFNIPSSVLKRFYQGHFNPLTKEEKNLLSLFKNHKGNFYIIAYKGKEGSKSHILNHELAHGLFYTNKNYKKQVLRILSKYDLSEIKEELLDLGDYHESVLDDEIQAYSISLSHTLDSLFDDKMKEEIQSIFNKHIKSV